MLKLARSKSAMLLEICTKFNKDVLQQDVEIAEASYT